MFAGKVDLSVLPGDTLDIHPELHPTYCCTAETMQDVPLDLYDLVVADPALASLALRSLSVAAVKGGGGGSSCKPDIVN